MPVFTVFDVPIEIQKELLENEEILWAGKPEPGIKFTMVDIFNIPFSIAWCIGMFFIILPHCEWPILSVFFFLAGIYITVGRFFYNKWQRSNTFYVITPNRILIESGIFDSTIRSFEIAILVDLDLSERSDGSGTVKLEAESPFAGLIVKGFGADKAPALEFIADARKVYELILQQKYKKRNQL